MAKTYDTYKDSGIAWIGEIPGEWEVSKMKYIGTYINGYAFKPTDWQNSGKPIIRIQDLTGSISNSNYYNGDLEEKYLVKKGDILVSWAATLDAFIWEKEEEGWLNQHIFKALPNISVINKHYFFWLVKVAMSEMNNDNKHGIVMQHVTLGVFNLFKIPLPPLSEQEDIATCLDKKCGEIDSLISIQEEMISELLAYKQSVITEAVTKGLDKKAKMKNSGVEWIGDIPEHWIPTYPKIMFKQRNERAKQGERQLASSQKYGIVYQDEYMKQEGVNLVTVGKNFDILKHVEPNDFVISMRSFQGGLEYSDKAGCISSAYVMLIPNEELVYPPFFRWFFKSVKYINALQSTSNFVRDGQAMRYSHFIKVTLFQIPLLEQRTIASYLDEKIPQIDSLIALKQSKIESLKEYKKSIIYEYVTGKKRV